jgi:membrane-bound metal-dependent hydrolase YbcI (DUF457 family)
MPSPIAHVSAGYVLWRLFGAHSRCVADAGWVGVLAFAGLSLAPDMDSVLGVLSNDFGRYHNNISHSLLGALPVGALVYAFLKLTRLAPTVPWARAAMVCYVVHVGMDYFTHGRGVMALWPITSERFIAPVLLFYGLHWSAGWVSSAHVVTFVTEAIPSAIAIGLAYKMLRPKAAAEAAGDGQLP